MYLRTSNCVAQNLGSDGAITEENECFCEKREMCCWSDGLLRDPTSSKQFTFFFQRLNAFESKILVWSVYKGKTHTKPPVFETV